MKVMNLEISEKQYGFTCLDFNGLFFAYNFLFKIHFLRIKEPVFLSVRKLKLGFKKKIYFIN